MTAITVEKYNLREIIRKAMMTRYDQSSDGGRSLVFGLLTRLTSRMTLKELRVWNLWIRENVPGKEKN